jgi:amidophosphoribosyltransferase
MAMLEDFVAFRAALALHKDRGTYDDVVKDVYAKCKSQDELSKTAVENYVKAIYAPFSYEEISDKIAELLSDESINAKVKVIYQTVDNLHKACPDHTGDWYFTGDYPTIGGSKIVNKAFINFVEGHKKRAY